MTSKAALSVTELSAAFLTHLHSDHVAGVGEVPAALQDMVFRRPVGAANDGTIVVAEDGTQVTRPVR